MVAKNDINEWGEIVDMGMTLAELAMRFAVPLGSVEIHLELMTAAHR
jgi:hypothetical protein